MASPPHKAEPSNKTWRSFVENAVCRIILGGHPEQARLLWHLYKWNSVILIFWLGGRDQVRKALKFLYCRTCSTGLLKAQNRNCTIAAVGSSIAALIGITSQLFEHASQVHWLCRAFWNFSVFSAFLSAAFACKHTRFINNILLEDNYNTWHLKKWFHKGEDTSPAHPPLSVVLLLSGTEMFFDTSVISYAIGLGIYLGCVYQRNLHVSQDKDTSQEDSRNIFILYLLSGFTCFSIYFLIRLSPHPRELAEWKIFWDRRREEPFICTMKLAPGGGEECVDPDHHHERKRSDSVDAAVNPAESTATTTAQNAVGDT